MEARFYTFLRLAVVTIGTTNTSNKKSPDRKIGD